jgi:hypothetical protein
MRGLCAAIISAGALVGLGLSAVGVGMRYQNLVARDAESFTWVKWGQLDTAMMLIVVVLLCVLVAALAATFLGLAYHHERRHYERHGRNMVKETSTSPL